MKLLLVVGAILGFLSVGIGAFGAHALKESLGSDKMAIYETANRYQFYHTFAIFISVCLYFLFNKKVFLIAGYFFCAGIFIFSGSLYALSISGIRILGAITPIGGLFFLAGWVALGYASIRHK